MRIALAVLNLVWLLFALVVLAGDGPPAPGEDLRFVIWSFTSHLLSALMIFSSADSGQWSGLVTRALGRAKSIPPRVLSINRLILFVLIINVILIPLAIWHLALQPDHPSETGVYAFAVFMLLIPILNVAVLLRSAPKIRQRDARISLH